MTNARQNRGAGNQGEAYRNSSFWTKLEQKKKEKKEKGKWADSREALLEHT